MTDQRTRDADVTLPPQSRGPRPVPRWREEYAGGSAEAEREELAELAAGILTAQAKSQKKASAHGVPHAAARTFHAKPTLALDDAELTFLDLPEDLRVGFAQPGATYRSTVRFSNASGTGQPDYEPDLRGVALRVHVDDHTSHDLLMTNFPVSHARDARQFVAFAVATAGGTVSRVVGILGLVRQFGFPEVRRMLTNVNKARKQSVPSVATATYWSRGALTWGPTEAVRYLLRPMSRTPKGPAPSRTDPAYLSHEIARRLQDGPVQLELCVQRFVDDRRTPIEDTAVEWTERAAPPEPVAVLTLPQVTGSLDRQVAAEAVEALAFNPWNTTDDFRPLGNLNRARKQAYDASAAVRSETRWRTVPPLRNVLLGRAARRLFARINKHVPWYLLPVRAGLLNLEAFRQVLRAQNLIDTQPVEAPPAPRPVPPSPAEESRWSRSPDGRDNDLSDPPMGAVGAAFGRNLRPDYRPDLFDEPNPVVVSQELLTRETFLPATSLNLLAAAWIQFQVHDWVNHARYPLGQDDVVVPLPGDMTWRNTPGGDPERRMRIAGNESLETLPDGTERLFADAASHWWDGSEVYGSDASKTRALRDGAKIRLTPQGYLPDDTSGQEITGFNESWWLGLSGLHTLFAREHNVLCDELHRHYPGWTDERVFQTARLVVSALIAKIHTVEWTPAILGTEVIDIGLKSNWNGPPAGDWLTKLGIWLLDAHATTGIPKTKPDHHGVPYSLTEDFVTVYRLHPLIPDDYRLLDHRTGHLVKEQTFLDISGNRTDDEMRALGLENLLYSFGTAHPGAITLHNYPDALRHFERNGEIIDLSVVDLVRTRRRGVPRYNDFREGLHKPRVTRWEELSDDPETVRTLRRLYRSVDEVDTMVGLFGERPPEGFGFSDTAFRIFILMASRRLQSDRFLTVDFRPEIYSPLGMAWVAENSMTSVILRHCPDVAALLPRSANAFVPWRTVTPPPGPGS